MDEEKIVTEISAYETPTITEMGAFSEVTLGRPNWGFENDWSCVRVC